MLEFSLRSSPSLGDVLVVDKPYASILLTKHFGTHCYHCYKRCLDLIPCDCCPYVSSGATGYCKVAFFYFSSSDIIKFKRC